jgi:hypothetical protein
VKLGRWDILGMLEIKVLRRQKKLQRNGENFRTRGFMIYISPLGMMKRK